MNNSSRKSDRNGQGAARSRRGQNASGIGKAPHAYAGTGSHARAPKGKSARTQAHASVSNRNALKAGQSSGRNGRLRGAGIGGATIGGVSGNAGSSKLGTRGTGGALGASASANGAAKAAKRAANAANKAASARPSAGDRPSLADAEEGGLFSRRNFIYGAVGAGALAVAAGGGAAVYFATKAGEVDLEYLEVSSDVVTSLSDYALVEDASTRLSLYGSVDLPLGSLVWCNSDEVAACLLPTSTGSPLTQVALLMLGSATYNTVLEQAVGAKSGFEIYDVRASSNGMIWIEANILEGSWRVYTATIESGNLGKPSLADQGDSSYETPSIAAVGNYAFWQKQAPSTTTSDTKPSTQVLRTKMGQANAEVLFEGTRRMACALYGGDDCIVITPRSKLSSSYVCITKIDATSGEVADALTLPQSMAPFEVGCCDNGLMFCFESIYSYGDGIANLGTYVPRSKVAVADFSYSDTAETTGDPSDQSSVSTKPYDNTQNYSSAKWFRFNRTPTAAPAFCGDYLIVKSTYAVAGIDLKNGEYFTLDVDNGADTYGEYLATSGSHDTLVTYTSIDYTPVNESAQQMCRVKIWKPIDA